MELGGDTKAVLLAAGLIFIWALLLGVWKYRQIAASPDAQAHVYVDIAHRAALMYSFATLLIAAFVELSDWSTAVNAIAAFGPIAFFVAAIAGYCVHGWRRDTDNQFRDPVRGTHAFMWALIAVEIGGFAVLLAGFVAGQLV
jgi:hypothetical protein